MTEEKEKRKKKHKHSKSAEEKYPEVLQFVQFAYVSLKEEDVQLYSTTDILDLAEVFASENISGANLCKQAWNAGLLVPARNSPRKKNFEEQKQVRFAPAFISKKEAFLSSLVFEDGKHSKHSQSFRRLKRTTKRRLPTTHSFTPPTKGTEEGYSPLSPEGRFLGERRKDQLNYNPGKESDKKTRKGAKKGKKKLGKFKKKERKKLNGGSIERQRGATASSTRSSPSMMGNTSRG